MKRIWNITKSIFKAIFQLAKIIITKSIKIIGKIFRLMINCFKKIYPKLIIYGVSFGILVATFILEILHIHFFAENFNSASSLFDISLALIPCILTVISVSLSLSDKEIMGLKRRDFDKLRSKFHINFLGMILTSIFIFSFYLFFNIKKLYISIIVLDILALLFCTFFCIEEIPILSNNERRLFKILKRAYKNPNSNTNREEKIRNLITASFRKSILYYGFDKVFSKISKSFDEKDKVEFFEWLLGINRSYLVDLAYFSQALNKFGSTDFEGIDIFFSTKKSYENIQSLISSNQDCYIFNYIKNSSYWIENSLLLLHQICKNCNFDSLERNNLEEFVSCITFTYSINDEIYNIFTQLIIFTIPVEDHWFIESLLTITFPLNLFEKSSNYYGVFIVILLYYFIRFNKSLSQKNKDYLDHFIKEKTKTINSFGYNWVNNVEKFIQSDQQVLVEMLPLLLKIYNLTNNFYYTHVENTFGSYIIDKTTTFSKKILIDCWVQLFMCSNSFGNKKPNLTESFKELSEEEKRILSYLIGEKVSSNNETNKSEEFDFINYIETNEFIEINDNHKEALMNFKNQFFSRLTDSRYKPLDDEQLESNRRLVIENFNNLIDKNVFANKNEIKKDTMFLFSFLVTNDAPDQLINSFFKINENLLYKVINDKLTAKIGIKRKNIDYLYTSDEAKKIKDFDPTYQGRGRCLSRYNLYVEQFFAEIKTITDFQPHTYLKEGAVIAGFEISENDTRVRQLNDEELERIINKDYKQVDDLYVYSDYGTKETEYYVTKSRLKEILSKKFFLVEVSYYVDIDIDLDKVLVFRDSD